MSPPDSSAPGAPTRGALIVFAKEPVAGRVKTRLSPPLTLDEAAEVYSCMLDDVLRVSAAAAVELGLQPILALDPPEAIERFRARAPHGFLVEPQVGADLGARMQHAVERAFASGHGRVLLRGSDSPALGPEALRAAFDAVGPDNGADLALAPDPDGGYGLVALARPADGLFSHPMSTDSVLQETRARAEAIGLRHVLLEPGFDVDVAEDLGRLEALRASPEARHFPNTLQWLARSRKIAPFRPIA